MKKLLLLILLLVLLVGAAYRYDYGLTQEIVESTVETIVNLDDTLLNNRSVAMREARITVQEAMVLDSEIIETGPCLADVLVPGWSLDIVHQPRTEEDELLINKCPSFDTGETQYLIEYDTLGEFIRIVERE